MFVICDNKIETKFGTINNNFILPIIEALNIEIIKIVKLILNGCEDSNAWLILCSNDMFYLVVGKTTVHKHITTCDYSLKNISIPDLNKFMSDIEFDICNFTSSMDYSHLEFFNNGGYRLTFKDLSL